MVFGNCDNSVREKDWRCRKRGTQATRARQGDLGRVTRVRQRESFERAHILCLRASASATPSAAVFTRLMAQQSDDSLQTSVSGTLRRERVGQAAENVHTRESLACRKRVAPASSPTLHACSCARPSRACFGHKTVQANHA